jgi:chromosomal replication initiation ATPase DnaA
MQQLALPILPQVVYRPEHFLMHSGVKGMFTEAQAVLSTDTYGAVLITGVARSGKTHLAITLAAQLGGSGRFPRFIDGGALRQFLESDLGELTFSADEVVIIDDIHLYLESVMPGGSGPYVNFIEKLRAARCHLLLTSRLELGDFPCDAHVMSRLKEATPLRIEDPDAESVAELLAIMARQRGIQLAGRKLEFLERRIRRSVASIEEYLEKVVHLTAVLGQRVSLSLLGDAL